MEKITDANALALSSHPTKPRNPQDWFHEMATHYVLAQIHYHLNQCGVFASLIQAPDGLSASELAEKLDLQEAPLAVLLEYISLVDALVTKSKSSEKARYCLTAFGVQVLRRYSRETDGQTQFNLFDVRVGAYEPVWAAMSGLLKGTAQYGVDVHRRGEIAAEGLFKVTVKLKSALFSLIEGLECSSLVELGPTSGLLRFVAEEKPRLALYGVDYKSENIAKIQGSMGPVASAKVNWIQQDLFHVAEWAASVPNRERALIYSAHFHEFMARGSEAMIQFFRELRTHFPKSHLVMFEEPKLEPGDRAQSSAALWNYSASNFLIHHLIGNGQILPEAQWHEMAATAGLRLVKSSATECFGFKAFVYALES